eukprot:159349-Rhodomonas_salina.1
MSRERVSDARADASSSAGVPDRLWALEAVHRPAHQPAHPVPHRSVPPSSLQMQYHPRPGLQW